MASNDTDIDTAPGVERAGETETETRVLVGCGAEKQASRAPAREIYTSHYFQKKREYAEAHADEWTVLSALYGSLAKNSLTRPYDVTMDDYPLDTDEHSEAEYRTTEEWAASVVEGIENCVLNLERWEDRQPLGRVEMLAGQQYVAPLRDGLDALADEHGFEVVYPFDDTSGIGEQIEWLTERIETAEGLDIDGRDAGPDRGMAHENGRGGQSERTDGNTAQQAGLAGFGREE